MVSTKTISGNIEYLNHSFPAEYPSECPVCHHHSDIKKVAAHMVGADHRTFEVVFHCRFPDCTSYFIGKYINYQKSSPFATLEKFIPVLPNVSVFPEAIGKISPQFLSIYSEAEQAEASHLKQIAGPGYRKAFEYLIKDYAKKITPETEHTKIEEAFSGKVVDDYLKDARLQAVAKRALWLGNDETHYLKKWADQDIKDLINLIKLTVSWIETEQVSQAYINKMK